MAINVPLNAQFQNADQAATYLQGVCQSAVNKVKFNLGGASGAKAFSSLSQPLGRLTGQADEFTKSLDAANARVLAFGASVGVVNAITNAFKGLVNSTIEVEKAITAISVVGEQFSGKTKELSQGLFNIAKETGQSFSEVSKAALEFSRQGLKLEDTLSRTKDALILTRTTGLETTKSVEGLSAAVSAFAREGLSASRILNKLAAVDQAFKVSSADLIQAFERTGAAAQQAGVTFDELAGIVTALQADTSRGGAVIGNSLKTIFTRLGEVDKLEKLKGVGIIVEDLSGQILPASKILQNLANDVQGFSKLTQSGIFKDIAGTFQINQLIALVGDLTKKNSIAAEATKKSAGATNEAYVANEKLNQSLDAILNKVANTGKQLGSILGELGLTDNLNGLLDGINSFLEGANSLLQGDDLGSNFAKGFVKGIGGVLSGPGLGIFLAIIGKLSLDLAKFGVQSLKAFFGIGKAAADQKLVQESIVQTLIRNQGIANAILSTQGGQNAQALKFLGLLNQQAAAMQTIQGVAGGIASPVYAQGYRATSEGLQRKSKAAGGYLPAQEASDVRRGVGGASPSSKVVSIPNFAFGGGKRGTMIANTSEYIVPNYAGGGSAIFNQDMVKSMGLPAGAKKISAAGGFVPNFANLAFKKNKLNISEGYLLNSPDYKGVADVNKDSIAAGAINFRKTIFKISGQSLEKASKTLVEKGEKDSLIRILGDAGKNTDLDLFLSNRLSKKELVQSSLVNKSKKVSFTDQSRGLQNLIKGKLFERYLQKNRKDIVPYGNKPNEPLDFKFSNSSRSLGIEAKAGRFTNHSLIAKAINAKYGTDYKNDNADIIEKIGTVDLFTPSASGGYVPNFAENDTNKQLAILGLYGENGNIDGSPVYTLSSQRPNLFKDIKGNLEKNVTNLVKSYASRIGKKINVPVVQKDIKKSLNQIPSMSGFMFEDVLNQLAGPNFDTATESSGSRIDFPLTQGLREVFGVTGPQKYAEAKLDPYTADAAGSVRAKQKALAAGALGPQERTGDALSALRARAIKLRIGVSGRPNVRGGKEGLTPTQAQKNDFIKELIDTGIIKSDIKNSADQTKAIKRALGMASGGYVPNFAAAALQQAIAREKSAGLSDSQIYVDQDSALKSSMNPMGLMVANRRDEPAGGFQGIARARKEGMNPKLYGAASGFVPNYAASGTAKQFEDQLKTLVDAIKNGAKTQDQANKELQTIVGKLQNKGKAISQPTQEKYLKRGSEAIASTNNTEKVNKSFGDLAGKLIIAQTAMSFFSGSVEGATDTTSKWINALSQTIGSLVQFGFLLSTTGLGGKIGQTLKGLGKGIGLDRAAKAGKGLIAGVGRGAAAAAGPVGLAVAIPYLVNTIGESIKGVFKKDLSVTFDKLQKSADGVSASFTDLDKKTNATSQKEAFSLTATEFFQELTFGLMDTVSAYGQAYTGTEMNEEEVKKTISAVISAGVARGLTGNELKNETDRFLKTISKPNSNLGRQEIDLTDDKKVQALDFYLKESAILREVGKRAEDFENAQKLAGVQTEKTIELLNINKKAVVSLRNQYDALKNSILSIEKNTAFEKFANKTLLELNNNISNSQKSFEEFNNSVKEIKLDLGTDQAKALGSELEKINTTVSTKLEGVGAVIRDEEFAKVLEIQKAFANSTYTIDEFKNKINELKFNEIIPTNEIIKQFEEYKKQTQELERQAQLKEAQAKLDFINKTLIDQNSLVLEKQNSILEKRLGLIEKEFDYKKRSNDLDRQISDVKFETGLIGKSRTEQLTSQRGRVAETQKRANEDVIRELQQKLVDNIKAIEIPTTLSPDAQQNLKAQRNKAVSGILKQPEGTNPQEQIKSLTNYAGNFGQSIISDIAQQEQKASNYAFDQTIDAANGFANIILASAVDLSSSLKNAANTLSLPSLQAELEKAKRDQERASDSERGTPSDQMAGLEKANKRVRDLQSQIDAINKPDQGLPQATAAAKAAVDARTEKLRADKKAADAAAAQANAEEQKNATIQDGVVATKQITLNQAEANKAAKEFGQSLLELGDSFTNLKNLVRDYIEGLPASLANLQFGALQSTSANDLASNLIRQQVTKDSEALNPAGVSGSFEDQKKQTEFIAAQNALLEKRFELATAESATRRRELEYELKYLEEFLALKERGATVEELADLKNKQTAEQRSGGRGFEKGLDTIQDRINNYRTTLGEEIPNLFSSNLAQGLNDAISGAKDLKTALTDAATSFFQEITRKNISNLADMVTGGLGSLANTGFGALKSAFPGGVTTKASGGFIKGGSGTKDDVPAMLMGGEYVVKKSAVSKYGKGFLDAINSGNMRGYATGGLVDPETFPTQTGRSGFFTPGDYGQGAITGKNELLTFATQSFTGGQYDYMGGFGMSGASVGLEPESARLSSFGRENSPMFERVQQSKDEAFGVYLQGLQKEKEYSQLLDQIAKDKKARKKQLQMAIISAVASTALNFAGSAMLSGAKNSIAAGAKTAAADGKTFGFGAKFMAGAKGMFTGAGGQGGLANIFKGTGTQLSDLAIARQNAMSGNIASQSVQGVMSSTLQPTITESTNLQTNNSFLKKFSLANLFSQFKGFFNKSSGPKAQGGSDSSLLPLPSYIQQEIVPYPEDGHHNPFPTKRASGGLISGGSGTKDDVPAMLTGGEFVLNNRATQRLGVQNLNKLNNGQSVGSESSSAEMTQALISKLDELIQTTSNSSQSNVVVNVSSTDQQEENPADMNERDRELQKKIRQAVLDVIAQEKRLGGSLEKSR